MPTSETMPLIAHAIQLAIAPVFLLTGIAGLLGVMANRLARVIDRGRALEDAWPGFDEPARLQARAELVYLERRRKLASWSINFCTAAALLVCLVIAVLFLDEFFAHVQERQTRRAEQVFERASDEEIDIQGTHVHRTGSTILIAIQEHERTVVVSHARDGSDNNAILKNGRKRGDSA